MNLSNALLKHEQITTTLPKAKELRPYVEKIISLSKKNNLHSKRKAQSILQNENNTKKLFEVFSQRYKDRNGGYTRIIKLQNRKNDNADMSLIEFVDFQNASSEDENDNETTVEEDVKETK